jgi:hypothetical protein
MTWHRKLIGDPIPWLLEVENPSVRYGTLLDLLDRPEDDPEVQKARAAIAGTEPVARLLAAQKRDGYWVGRDYYLPKTSGTFWVLSALGDIGLTAQTEAVRRGCEYMFTFQRENGAFCRRRHVAGQGMVWRTETGPCTHARIVRFLIQFGYGTDPRTRAAMDWLLAAQRPDGMWLCHREGRYGCLRATLDALRAAVLDPGVADHTVVARAAAAVCDVLLEPRMSRYHVKEKWTVLEYPFFGYGVIPALETLARLGYTLDRSPMTTADERRGGLPDCGPAGAGGSGSKMAAAMDYLLGRQLPGGAWPLDQTPSNPPLDVGRPGAPNKWLTLEAARVVKRLYRET